MLLWDAVVFATVRQTPAVTRQFRSTAAVTVQGQKCEQFILGSTHQRIPCDLLRSRAYILLPMYVNGS